MLLWKSGLLPCNEWFVPHGENTRPAAMHTYTHTHIGKTSRHAQSENVRCRQHMGGPVVQVSAESTFMVCMRVNWLTSRTWSWELVVCMYK